MRRWVWICVGVALLGGCERFQTRLEKTISKYTGGAFTVRVYNGGTLVGQYEGEGYVWFERDASDQARHSGVVSFKTKDGRFVRVGSWGGVVIVEYK
ncbi:MAG: hypothetical protein D6771_06910 [Zetaproteobacteria bacterium]|nr:MAG: hypothetical protein D6771_06910 [Zetaproteobacteria bacterium]